MIPRNRMNSVAKGKGMPKLARPISLNAGVLVIWSVLTAQRIAFNEIVPDVARPGSVFLRLGLPVPSHI